MLLVGSTLKNVNGKKVTTIAELQDAIAQSGDIIKVQTTDNAMIAITKKDILDNEPRLARTYAYDISKGVKELIMKDTSTSGTTEKTVDDFDSVGITDGSNSTTYCSEATFPRKKRLKWQVDTDQGML